LPPFVARFATFCGMNCQLFCQPTEEEEVSHASQSDAP
jgi:hypothetical protein